MRESREEEGSLIGHNMHGYVNLAVSLFKHKYPL